MDILETKDKSTLHNSSLYFENQMWDSDISYDKDDEVISLDDSHRYKSLIDDNDKPLDDSDAWEDKGEETKLYIYDYWLEKKEYKKNDLVKYDGKGYQSLEDNNTFEPTNTDYWTELDHYTYDIWDSDTTYDSDDIVIYKKKDDNYYIFKSLDSDNNDEPTKSLKWIEQQPQNVYKALDIYLNTFATDKKDNKLIYYFDIKKSNSIALLNVDASNVKITVKDGDNKATYTKDLNIGVDDWGDYFYGDFDDIDLMNVFIDTAYVLDGTMKVEITSDRDRPIRVGKILIGYKKELGVSLYGATGSITDYSKKETDDYGNVYLKQGSYAVEVSASITIENAKLDHVFRKLASLRATPTLWLSGCEDKYETLNIYGYYKDFDMVLDNGITSHCSLTIQGLM